MQGVPSAISVKMLARLGLLGREYRTAIKRLERQQRDHPAGSGTVENIYSISRDLSVSGLLLTHRLNDVVVWK